MHLSGSLFPLLWNGVVAGFLRPCVHTYIHVYMYTCIHVHIHAICVKQGLAQSAQGYIRTSPGAYLLEGWLCPLKALNAKNLGTVICVLPFMRTYTRSPSVGKRESQKKLWQMVGFVTKVWMSVLATHLRWEWRQQLTVTQSEGTALVRSSCRGFTCRTGHPLSHQDPTNLGKKLTKWSREP